MAWWPSAVVYQVYPRSFADSDGDGVGDLPGIVSRLEHLVELGVDALWLSPFYRSPMADFGYDVSDYCDVDPLFGTLVDAEALIERAHGLGLKVIVDWVPNHTSDRHPWFEESRAGRDSARRGWYVWRDPAPDGGPPNDWTSTFGGGPAWTLDEPTGQHYLHSFLPQQPDLNWDEPAVREAMHDTLRFWLDRGVDGFRMDVVHKIGKDPALGDNEPGRRHDEDWPSVHERLRAIRRVLESYDGERIAVGEVYVLDQERLAAYVSTGDELHLAHNFFFLNLPWSADRFRAAVDAFEGLAGPRGWPAWCLGNHDHSRIASRYGPEQARVAAMLLLTLRGTPFLYQGDELGLADVPIAPEQVVDVDGRDPVRAPMPWEPSGGFTTGTPWLPVTPDAARLAVSAQAGAPGSMLILYRELLALRRSSAALHSGAYASFASGPQVFAFEREHADERLLIALNFSGESQAAGLPAQTGAGRILVSTGERGERAVDLGRLALGPHEGVIARAS